ncbi:MFS general substrate transporter [Aaosphaeria arxii CBS 175.79]|uniref:MFS general substrate transporter n=1 Tax=Aaosphaeria arxii CBS 175.79 TaxID=1450172 RepID=A0A6A5YBY5_9PLEO|nr:MFS general substrate transporter [Aaosphaeria arxii CBS 175.79]KAF2022134.1 MFS general substrate transporter [Aaosphaeria arxii CBS 175.79]
MSDPYEHKEKTTSGDLITEEGREASIPCSPSIHKTFSQRNEDEAQSVRSELPRAPDGGLHAWLKVFGGFLLYMNIWGFTISFGAFQAYYRGNMLSSSSSSAISWIGTAQAWLLILVGSLSGPLFDLGYFRSMLITGNVLIVIGLMMLSLCDQYWQIFLAQGLCMGLGAGLLYVPSLALVGIWFDKRRAVAMGIVMSGIAVGGVAYIMTFDRLISTAGFPWTIRTLGFMALFIALVSFPALVSGSSMLARPRKARALFDRSAIKDKLFWIFTGATFLNFLGYNVPYFYIPTFARERLGSSDSMAFYMLVMSISASFFGRLASGVAAHHLGSIVTWMICSLLAAMMAFVWIGIETERAMIAFSVVWGFLSASLVTLPSAAFASICPDLSRLGTRLGMSWGVTSIASLTGPPIAGALLRRKEGRTDFLGAQLWSGACLLLTAAATIERRAEGKLLYYETVGEAIW